MSLGGETPACPMLLLTEWHSFTTSCHPTFRILDPFCNCLHSYLTVAPVSELEHAPPALPGRRCHLPGRLTCDGQPAMGGWPGVSP